jgi:hypothetical protein
MLGERMRIVALAVAVAAAGALVVLPAGAGARGGIVTPLAASVPDAAISFTAPNDNGAMITGYTVTAMPGGATATGTASPITFTGLTAGTSYTFTVTATNSAGTGMASAASNAVVPTPGPQTLGKLALSFVSFAPARHGGLTTQQSGTGTTVSYSDSAAALTTFTIVRLRNGVERGGSCVAARIGTAGKHCVLPVSVGTFTHQDVVGENHVHFSGRVAGHALAPGLCQLQASAAVGGVSGPLRRVNFDVF